MILYAGVLILSEFTGASQSLGAGAILVNPWNITDLSAAIGDALQMTDAERRERHRQNYMHISIHTSQTWADTFISELNDTHVEAELRTKHIPPQVGRLCAVLYCAVLCCAAERLQLWFCMQNSSARVHRRGINNGPAAFVKRAVLAGKLSGFFAWCDSYKEQYFLLFAFCAGQQ